VRYTLTKIGYFFSPFGGGGEFSWFSLLIHLHQLFSHTHHHDALLCSVCFFCDFFKKKGKNNLGQAAPPNIEGIAYMPFIFLVLKFDQMWKK
jgi:hypothetical protein